MIAIREPSLGPVVEKLLVVVPKSYQWKTSTFISRVKRQGKKRTKTRCA